MNNWFADFWDQGVDPKHLSISDKVIIIDEYVLEQGCVLLLVKTVDTVIFWTFVEREKFLENSDSTFSNKFKFELGHLKVISSNEKIKLAKEIAHSNFIIEDFLDRNDERYLKLDALYNTIAGWNKF